MHVLAQYKYNGSNIALMKRLFPIKKSVEIDSANIPSRNFIKGFKKNRLNFSYRIPIKFSLTYYNV